MKKHEEKLKEELKVLKQTNKRIVLFGAREMGYYGKCVVEHYGKQTAFFVDNDKEMVGKQKYGIKVCTTEEIHADDVVYICSFNKSNIAQIDKQLRELGIRQVYGSDALFYAYQTQIMHREIDSCAYAQTIEKLGNPAGNLIIGSGVGNLPLIITEKCTLRCRDCGVFMPYYAHPRHYAAEEVIEWVQRFTSSVDVIGTLNIIGGEPFLHPELDKICKKLSTITNIHQIIMVTNGTVVPCDEILASFCSTVTRVIISDYGELSRQKERLAAKLDEFCIPYTVFQDEAEWTRLLPPKAHRRTATDNTKIRQNCKWADIAPKIIAGEFHLCDYSAGVAPFKVVPGTEDDYLTLTGETYDSQAGRRKIRYILDEKPYLAVCDYCEFYQLNKTPRAVQVKGALNIRSRGIC